MGGGKRRSSALFRADAENLIPANGMETAAMPSADTHSLVLQFKPLKTLDFIKSRDSSGVRRRVVVVCRFA